jgi:hypothetical protein
VEGGGLSNVSTTVVPQGNVVLKWKDNTTSLTLAYAVAVAPSYQFQAQPLLTNNVSFSVTQQTPVPQLLVVASANYGRGDEIASSANSVAGVSYVSYTATGGVLYKFTPKTFLNITYQYANYDNQSGATRTSFDRHVVSILFAQAFY